MGPNSKVPLNQTSDTYCLCYNPVKTEDNYNLDQSTQSIIFRNTPNQAARFKIVQQNASLSPNIVELYPRNGNLALNSTDFIYLTFDRSIFISAFNKSVLTITIASFILDDSCFGNHFFIETNSTLFAECLRIFIR